jgi:hypothetical protein
MLYFAALPTGKEFKKFREQAKRRNWLPDVSSGYDFGRQRAFSNSFDTQFDSVRPGIGSNSPVGTYNNDQFSNSFDNDRSGYRNRGFSSGLDWSLRGLIYDNEVTDIISEQRRIAGIRNDLIDQLHDAFYKRRRKQLEFILKPSSDQTEQFLQKMEIEEHTDRLDSMTGGWFRTALIQRGLTDDNDLLAGSQADEDMSEAIEGINLGDD